MCALDAYKILYWKLGRAWSSNPNCLAACYPRCTKIGQNEMKIRMLGRYVPPNYLGATGDLPRNIIEHILSSVGTHKSVSTKKSLNTMLFRLRAIQNCGKFAASTCFFQKRCL